MKLSASAAVLLLGAALASVLPNLSTQRELKAEIEIAAAPERVWKILTDFSAYSIWNPYIYPAKGEARAGAQLELTLHPGPKTITFQPIVLAAEPNRELRWFGRTFASGVFDREQSFTIETIDPHRVRLTSRELIKGFLTPFIGGLLDDTQRGLEIMNQALRARADLLGPEDQHR